MTRPLDDIVRDWVTDHVGEVISFERQHRWRPAWFVVARGEHRSVRLYVRGNRDGFGSMDVSREASILRVLEASSIPVPHVYGEIDGGRAVVMDWLPENLQYVEWFHQFSLHAIESIARQAGVDLEPVTLPASAPSEYSGVLRGLPTIIEALDAPTAISEYHRATVASVARFCERVHSFDGGIASADLDDIGELLAARPADRSSGDAILEDFIRDAGPEHDHALIRLLHRRVMRQMLLLEPVLAAPGGIGHLPSLSESPARGRLIADPDTVPR